MDTTIQTIQTIQESTEIAALLAYIPQTIATVSEANEVGRRLLAVKEVIKQRTEYFESMRIPAYEAYQAVLRQAKEALKLPQAVEASYKKLLSDWVGAERARVLAEEAVAAKEAARLAQEAKAEAERLAVLEAAEMESRGEHLEAAVKIDEAISAPLPYVAPVAVVPVAKPEGLTYRETWTFRVVDAARVPREYLMVDNVKIGQVVRALKDAASISGVEIYSERTPVKTR